MRWPASAPLNVVQRQLRHTNLRVISTYVPEIDNTEIIAAVNGRRALVLSASSLVRL